MMDRYVVGGCIHAERGVDENLNALARAKCAAIF
jgi:hypothetical protein